jgi:two-component system response regulator YesN
MTTPLKVYEVGLKVGYPSYRYFVRVFKQHFGIFPTQVRKGREGDA